MRQAFFSILGLALLCPLLCFGQYDLNPTEEKGFFGIKDNQGKVLIPFEYKSLEKDPAGDNNFIAQKDVKFGVINLQNEVLFPFEYDRLFFNYTNPLVLEATKGGKMGLLHIGKAAMPCEYDNIESRADMAGTYFVTKNNKVGCIDIEGKVVLPLEFDELHSTQSFPELLVAKKNGKWGFLKSDGSIHMDLIYDIKGEPGYQFRFDGNVAYFESNQIFVFGKSGKFGTIDCQNKIHIPFEYEDLAEVGYPSEPKKQRYFAKKNGKYGVINASNKVFSSFRFAEYLGAYKSYGILSKDGQKMLFVDEDGKEHTDLSGSLTDVDTLNGEHLVFINRGNGVGLMSMNAKFVIEPIYEGLSFINSQNGLLTFKDKGKYGLINDKGQVLANAEYDEIARGYGFDYGDYKVRKGDAWGLIDMQGKLVVPVEYEECETKSPDETVYKVKKKGKYGLLGQGGNVVAAFEYDEIDIMCGRGYILLTKDNKYGYFSCTGEQLTPVHFDGYADFRQNEIAPIKKDGKFGYIIKHRGMLTEIKYDEAQQFDNSGFAKVTLNGKKGKINKEGKEFWK